MEVYVYYSEKLGMAMLKKHFYSRNWLQHSTSGHVFTSRRHAHNLIAYILNLKIYNPISMNPRTVV